MLLLLLACPRTPICLDEDSASCDGSADTSLDTELVSPLVGPWSGERGGEGFGTALAATGSEIWVGAPFGGAGRVYALRDDGDVEIGLEGDGLLGYGLAEIDGALAASAPAAGRLVDGGGATLFEGDLDAMIGGRLYSDEAGWLATYGAGALIDGAIQELPARSGGLARVQSEVAIGLPRGEIALWIGGVALERAAELDAAGFALCAADLDGDGLEDLAVGAPLMDRVYLLTGDVGGWSLVDAEVLEGEGRFGHALACGEGALYVGAPMTDGGAGAVYGLDLSTGDAAPLASGEGLDQLGAALLLRPEGLYVGAPQGEGEPGYVDRLDLE